MALEKKINDDIKAAMIAKNRAALDALRSIKSALLIEKTGKDQTSGEIPESVEINLLKKLAKQRREAAQTYHEQGREDLAEVEEFQLEIIEKYLPEQMSEEQIRAGVKEIIHETGASSMADMGKVMGAATTKFSGRADNKKVSEIVRNILS